jgi:hypothetical protein
MTSSRIVRYLRKTAIALVVGFLFIVSAGASADKTRDLIVVLDVSASMLDIFDTAKNEAKQFISSAQIGDRITVITFGEKSNLLIRSRVKSSHTIGRILSEIDKLSPVDLNTNLPLAMERGLKEMEQFYEEDPNAERTFMWLSDDKNNPPKDLPNLITFASLKEDHSNRMPDQNWFVFKKPIETETKTEMDWFMDWAKRNKVLLKAEVATPDLGKITLPQNETEFTVAFTPNSAGIWGTSFSVVAEVTDEERGNYSASVPISPPVVVCDGEPWTQKFRISLPERPGSYVCRVSFVLPSDKLLEISPPQLALDAKLESDVKEEEKRVASLKEVFDTNQHATLHNRASQDSMFSRELRGQMIGDFLGAVDRKTMVFGPILAGGQYSENASLTVPEDVPLDAISMKTTFQLPEGIELKPEFRREGGKVIADLCLLVDAETPVEDGWETEGVISFVAKGSKTKITPSAISARVYARPDLASWGRREFQTNPTYARLTIAKEAAAKFAAPASKVAGALLLLWVFLYLLKRYVLASTDLVGMLEIARNPTKQKIRYFNLQRLGKLKKRNHLTIGRSRKADIILPHPSVGDFHAKIMTTKIDASVIIFIQPIEGHQLKVNDITYSRQKEISDCDKLTIGEFIFMYKRPEVYRETVVHFNNGASLRGTLISWDIDSTSFEFLPVNAPSINARKVIPFSELKKVSFVKKTERFSLDRLFGPSRPIGYPVEVFFKDGEMLEGYMMSEAGEWSKRFYVIPKEAEQVALILVERNAIESVMKCDHFKQSFFHLRRMLRALVPHTSS